MNIIKRLQSPTPSFFQKLRNISLIIAALGAAILAAPVALPAVVLHVAGSLKLNRLHATLFEFLRIYIG